MKAAVWHGKGDVRVQEAPDPGPPPTGQVRIDVSLCGICGTDLHEFYGGPVYIPLASAHPLTGIQAPVIIGHEISGRVAAVGEGVTRFKKGDRIAACPIVGCQDCRWCRSGAMAQCERVAFMGTSWTGGGFAEHVNLNEYQCFALPDTLDDAAGALVEPFSATFRAALRGGVEPGANVAVVGAGPIGLLTMMAARILGAKRVVAVELDRQRREAALWFGANAGLDPAEGDSVEQANALTAGEGFDIVFECAGADRSPLLAARLTRTRGTLVVLGVFDRPAAIDFTDIVFREKTLIGSMSGYGRYEETIERMADPRFLGARMITDRIRLDDLVAKGFHPLRQDSSGQIKILVEPGG